MNKKKKANDQPLRVVLFKFVMAKMFGDEVAERLARKVSTGVVSVVLAVAAVLQVMSAIVWAAENISKVEKWRSAENVRVMIYGAASHFYPATSNVTLSVDISDRVKPTTKIEAKEDQIGLFNATGGSAGFEKRARFPEPIEFSRGGLAASQYSVIARFTGNERGKPAESEKYDFTVFDEDRFDPVGSLPNWYQISEDGTKAGLHEPFFIRPDPASHKGDYLLFLQSRSTELAKAPMLWFTKQIMLPCELHLKAGPIGPAAGLIVSFDDQVRVLIGGDPDNHLRLPDGSDGFLTVYRRQADGSFLQIKKVQVPQRILFSEQPYRLLLSATGGASGRYALVFDVPGVFPAPITTPLESSIELAPKGNIGLGLISESNGTYVRDFQAFGVPSN